MHKRHDHLSVWEEIGYPNRGKKNKTSKQTNKQKDSNVNTLRNGQRAKLRNKWKNSLKKDSLRVHMRYLEVSEVVMATQVLGGAVCLWRNS